MILRNTFAQKMQYYLRCGSAQGSNKRSPHGYVLKEMALHPQPSSS